MKQFFMRRRTFLLTFLISLFSFFTKSEKLNSKITIAFGSCSNQNREMKHWRTILKKNPDYLILLGDNVYGDFYNEEALQLINAYNILKKDKYFNLLRKRTKIIPIWDDHDYGKNDGGNSWKFKEKSKKIFLDFFSAESKDVRRKRNGIYKSWKIISEKTIKIIALDTRTFKSDFKLNNKNSSNKKYIEDYDKNKTILGEYQWKWLFQEVKDNYDLLIILSSFQVISKSHGWEKWNNFPIERTKLLEVLGSIKEKSIILSGDRHLGGMYKTEFNNKRIYEFTSSSFNQKSFNTYEPDDLRFSKIITRNNYGLLSFNFTKRQLNVDINSTNYKEELLATKNILI